MRPPFNSRGTNSGAHTQTFLYFFTPCKADVEYEIAACFEWQNSASKFFMPFIPLSLLRILATKFEPDHVCLHQLINFD